MLAIPLARRPGAATAARLTSVSLLSTGLTLVALALLEDAGIGSVAAATLATACGFACSYPLTRHLAFRAAPRSGDAVAILALGSLSLAGLGLSAAATFAADAAAGHAALGGPSTLAAEEAAEAVVLGGLFLVRLLVSRALFTGGRTAPP